MATASTARQTRSSAAPKRAASTVASAAGEDAEISATSASEDEGVLATLKDYLPDKSVKRRYVNRKIQGVKDFVVFDGAKKMRRNIMLVGPTGAAKTMAARAYAAEKELPFVVLDCNGAIRPQDINGGWIVLENGRHEWQPSLLAQCAHEGGVLMLDEINSMPPEMAFLLYSLLSDSREMTLSVNPGHHLPRKFEAHPDLMIFAAYNPLYYGSRPISQALSGRFLHLDWGYNKAVENRVLRYPSLTEYASILRKTKTIKTDVSTKMLMDVPVMLEHWPYKVAAQIFSDAFAQEVRGEVYKMSELKFKNIKKEMAEEKEEAEVKKAAQAAARKARAAAKKNE